jgi:vacuolar protein sorting-associated protein 26
MASFFSFSSPLDVDVRLDNEEERQQVEVKQDKDRKEKCPVYFDGESVRGQVSRCSIICRYRGAR